MKTFLKGIRRSRGEEHGEDVEIEYGGALMSAEFLFTEKAIAGIYTKTFPIAARSTVVDIEAFCLASADPGNVGWAADTALLDIGDTLGGPGSYCSGVDIRANFYDVYDPFGNPGNTSASGGFDVTSGGGSPIAAQMPWSSSGEGMPGIRYPTDDEIEIVITTTIGSPPVVPGAVMLFKVVYFAPVTVENAIFS